MPGKVDEKQSVFDQINNYVIHEFLSQLVFQKRDSVWYRLKKFLVSAVTCISESDSIEQDVLVLGI